MSEHTGNHDRGYEKVIGTHHLRFEPPDLYIITFAGDLSEAEARTVIGELRSLTRCPAGHFELIDMRQLGSMAPGARRAAVESQPAELSRVLGCAIFGASFQLRVIVSTVARVMRLVNRDAAIPIGFFETKAEALGWLEALRCERSRSG